MNSEMRWHYLWHYLWLRPGFISGIILDPENFANFFFSKKCREIFPMLDSAAGPGLIDCTAGSCWNAVAAGSCWTRQHVSYSPSSCGSGKPSACLIVQQSCLAVHAGSCSIDTKPSNSCLILQHLSCSPKNRHSQTLRTCSTVQHFSCRCSPKTGTVRRYVHARQYSTLAVGVRPRTGTVRRYVLGALLRHIDIPSPSEGFSNTQSCVQSCTHSCTQSCRK
jgi:hypothetical protein